MPYLTIILRPLLPVGAFAAVILVILATAKIPTPAKLSVKLLNGHRLVVSKRKHFYGIASVKTNEPVKFILL